MIRFKFKVEVNDGLGNFSELKITSSEPVANQPIPLDLWWLLITIDRKISEIKLTSGSIITLVEIKTTMNRPIISSSNIEFLTGYRREV